MLRKIPILLIAFILFSNLIFAQKDLDQLPVETPNFFEKDWSIGFSYGMTKFNGDISQYPFASAAQTNLICMQDSVFKDSRSAFSSQFREKD